MNLDAGLSTRYVVFMKDRTDRLRELLRTAQDFQEPWNYFHDELALDPDFMRLGVRRTSEKLSAALDVIGTRLLGTGTKLRRSTILFIEDFSFWHGTCALGAHMGVCFYFDDADQGLLGLIKDIQRNEVLLARISLVTLPSGTITVGRGGQA